MQHAPISDISDLGYSFQNKTLQHRQDIGNAIALKHILSRVTNIYFGICDRMQYSFIIKL